MTPRTATATAAKRDLSRNAIVERALTVMDTDGPDAVTIRRIAQEFGVTPMALYWHVANKDELLAAMGDALIADVVPPPATGSWSVQLRGVVEALRAACVEGFATGEVFGFGAALGGFLGGVLVFRVLLFVIHTNSICVESG